MEKKLKAKKGPAMDPPVLTREHIQFINAMLGLLTQAGELRIVWSGRDFDQIYVIRTTIYDLKQMEASQPG